MSLTILAKINCIRIILSIIFLWKLWMLRKFESDAANISTTLYKRCQSTYILLIFTNEQLNKFHWEIVPPRSMYSRTGKKRSRFKWFSKACSNSARVEIEVNRNWIPVISEKLHCSWNLQERAVYGIMKNSEPPDNFSHGARPLLRHVRSHRSRVKYDFWNYFAHVLARRMSLATPAYPLRVVIFASRR